jgi:hypothetical protein
VKTVGLMGGGRTYDHVVGLRAVTSTDGVTADFDPFDMKFLGSVATRIINEVSAFIRWWPRRCANCSTKARMNGSVSAVASGERAAHPGMSRERM